MNAYIEFNNDKKLITIPQKYNIFIDYLYTLFDISKENCNEMIISYLDSDNDKIIILNELDYIELKKELFNNNSKRIQLKIEKAMPRPLYQHSNNNSIPNNTNKLFNIVCVICHIKQINEVFYYCQQCAIFICSQCEENYAYSHPHSFLKLRSMEMLLESEQNFLSNDKKNSFDDKDHIIKHIKDPKDIINSIKEVSNSISNWFNKNNNSEDPSYLISSARSQYDLKNVTD